MMTTRMEGEGGRERKVALRCDSPCGDVVTWLCVVGFRGAMLFFEKNMPNS